jgi:hypothetical protein
VVEVHVLDIYPYADNNNAKRRSYEIVHSLGVVRVGSFRIVCNHGKILKGQRSTDNTQHSYRSGAFHFPGPKYVLLRLERDNSSFANFSQYHLHQYAIISSLSHLLPRPPIPQTGNSAPVLPLNAGHSTVCFFPFCSCLNKGGSTGNIV